MNVFVPAIRWKQVVHSCTKTECLCEALIMCHSFAAGKESTHIICHWSCGRAHAKQGSRHNSCSVVRLLKTQAKRWQLLLNEVSVSLSLCSWGSGSLRPTVRKEWVLPMGW